MKARSLLILLALIAVAAFAMLNWAAFNASTSLSFGVATVQAPLGLIMLGVLAFFLVFFLVFVVYLQTTVMLDSRLHAKELRANRELADKAEASRFTELRAFLEAELNKHAQLGTESRTTVLARIDGLAIDLRGAVEHSGNTVAAFIGELDDRLERGSLGSARPPTV